MKAKFNIDITITNDCGSEYHVKCSSSGCSYTAFLNKKFEFDLRVFELMNEELSLILASEKL